MTIALYMDHNVLRAVVEGCRSEGLDVLTAYDDGWHERTDTELLDRAGSLSRAKSLGTQHFVSDREHKHVQSELSLNLWGSRRGRGCERGVSGGRDFRVARRTEKPCRLTKAQGLICPNPPSVGLVPADAQLAATETTSGLPLSVQFIPAEAANGESRQAYSSIAGSAWTSQKETSRTDSFRL